MFIPAVCGEPSWTCKSVIIRHFTWLLQKKNCYSSVIIASCFHIHENKKLGGSTIC